VTVAMGYGHQRTAYPLKSISFKGKAINANNYDGIPDRDRKIWLSSKDFYEFISRLKRIPLIGNVIFSIYDKFQQIPSFYPERDLSKPTLALKKIFSIIKRGWGQDLILRLKEKPRPLLTTFYMPAFMAEVFNYPGEIFCIICDADIARSWVSLNPHKSKIKYFAPCNWVQDRLKLYGVKEENIFLTGFPLPKENIGDGKLEILKKDLAHRLLNLDPQKKYRELYKPLIKGYLGELPGRSDHPLTIMFSIGGAGAQKEIALKAVKSLTEKIKKGEIKIILAAGVKAEVKNYFLENIKKLGLKKELDKNIEVLSARDLDDYFEKFNQKLRKTDILWTKPSELSFYAGLGIPIIIAPSIGSQEDLNKKWLLKIGAGFSQDNPKYTDQWLFDLIEGGRLAEAAMQGFVEIEKLGTYNIERVITSETPH